MAELKELQEEAAALKIEIAELESTLAAKKERREEIVGSSWGRRTGKIGDLKEERERSLLWENDAELPKVVWMEESEWDTDIRVVSRVTPKRIFVRRYGWRSETQYHRDGTPVSGYGRSIDVEATLGEMAGKE